MFFSPASFILKGEIVSKKVYFQGVTLKKVASHFHINGDKSLYVRFSSIYPLTLLAAYLML